MTHILSMASTPKTIWDLPRHPVAVIRHIQRLILGMETQHILITQDGSTSLGDWLESVLSEQCTNLENPAPTAPDGLPPLPPLPAGFDAWIYRGINYASPGAIMVTSYDITTDPSWDPPAMFQTDGQPDTHYMEAVINHHWICECPSCRLDTLLAANEITISKI